MYRLQQSWGVGHVISVLRGERTDRILQRGHDGLSTYAILKERSRNELRDLIWQLIGQGYLEQSGEEYPVLRLTAESRSLLRGDASVRLRQPMAAPPRERKRRRVRAPQLDVAVDRDLFEQLRQWRRSEAESRGVPPYIIFSDRTLREIARARPATLTALRDVYGIGEAKLEAFGRGVLDVVTSTGDEA